MDLFKVMMKLEVDNKGFNGINYNKLGSQGIFIIV